MKRNINRLCYLFFIWVQMILFILTLAQIHYIGNYRIQNIIDNYRKMTEKRISVRLPPISNQKSKKPRFYIENSSNITGACDLSLLNYKIGNTLIYEKERKIYKQTDEHFLQDIDKIMRQRREKNLIEVIGMGKEQLTQVKCNELDYKARIHAKANIVNSNSNKNYEELSKLDRCQCGCNKGRGKPFPLTVSDKKLSVLGSGVLLQLFLQKSSIIFTLVFFLIYGVFASVTNLIGMRAVVTQSCSKEFYCRFKQYVSDQNKDQSFSEVQNWLGLAFCIICIFGIRVLKFVGNQKNNIIDSRLESASDYAIKVSNLPRGSYQETELILYIERIWKERLCEQLKKKQQKSEQESNKIELVEYLQKNKLDMKAVQIIYNMQFSRKINDKLLNLVKKLDNYLYSEKGIIEQKRCWIKEGQQYMQTKDKIIEAYELMQDLRKRFLNDPAFRKAVSSTSCIIQFRLQKSRKQILKYFGVEKVGLFKKIQMTIQNCLDSRKQILFKGKILKIERAPEPSDLLWQNCEKPESIKRRIVIVIFTFLLILISFSIILGLQYLQKYAQRNPLIFTSDKIVTIINIATSFAMQIINSILWKVMGILLDLEYNHTKTQKIVSQMNKVLFLSTINVISLPIISNYLIEGTNFIYGNDGLSGFAFDYHVSAAIATAKGLISINQIIKFIAIAIKRIRYRIIRYLCRNPQDVNFETGDPNVNKFYEGAGYDVAENYVFLIMSILHAAFFCKLQPIILAIAVVTMALLFMVNKVRLLRFCKIPDMSDHLIFETAVYMLSLVPVYYGAGSMVLSYFQNIDNPTGYKFDLILPLVCIGLGLVCFFNPKDIINRIIRLIVSFPCCINASSLVGDYENNETETETDSAMSLATSEKSVVEDKYANKRIESYYEESNMLTLFGFQSALKDEQNDDIELELKRYCQSFFTKNVDEVLKQVTEKCLDDDFIKKQSKSRNHSSNARNQM